MLSTHGKRRTVQDRSSICKCACMANCMDWRVARARAARHAPAPTRARAHHHARHERRWGSRCRKNSVLREPVRAWDICEFPCSYGVPAVVFLVQSVSAESCSVSGDFVNFFSWIFPGRAERRGQRYSESEWRGESGCDSTTPIALFSANTVSCMVTCEV